MAGNELTEKQIKAAQLLALGTIDKQDVAKEVGVAKQTLYNWINKNANFNAEVDSLRRDYKDFGKGLIEAKLTEAVTGYWNLIHRTKNPLVAAKGYEYFIDHAIGKAPNKAEITVDTTITKKNTDIDLLEQEHLRFIKDMGEVIEVEGKEVE